MAHQRDVPPIPFLSPSEQAEVNRLIQTAGFDPTEFVWRTQSSRYYPSALVFSLVHTPTGSSFRFEFLESALGMNRVSISDPGEYGQEQIRAAGSWEAQTQQVREWLSRVLNAEK